jgi:hypothetical protein
MPEEAVEEVYFFSLTSSGSSGSNSRKRRHAWLDIDAPDQTVQSGKHREAASTDHQDPSSIWRATAAQLPSGLDTINASVYTAMNRQTVFWVYS